MTHALHVTGLTKDYGGQTVVDSVSMTVEAGQIVALLGPNGAGKSTTMKICAGFIGADAGDIRIAGVDAIQNPKAARRYYTYLPENVVLYDELSGRENLTHLLRIATGKTADPAEIDAALRRADLAEDTFSRKAATYSKGMRQKVGLALTLAKEAKLLLLDEPTSGLDPHSAAEFNTALKAIAAQGVGVLMATHDIWRAREVSDRLLLMAKGRVVAELDPKGLSAEEIEQRFFIEAGSDRAA